MLKIRLSIISLLIVITLIFSFFYNYNIYEYKNVPITKENVTYATDKLNGGTTKAELKIIDNKAFLNCNLESSHKWYFCEIKIQLSKDLKKGWDVSDYDDLFINLKTHGQEEKRVRVFIRNYNENYTNLEKDPNSFKINELEYNPNDNNEKNFLNLKDFNVANWWIGLRKIKPEFQGRELNNVPLIEISSSGYAKPENFNMELKEIYFRKKIISKEEILLFNLFLWLFFGFIYFLQLLLKAKKELKITKEEKEKLDEILKLLNIEKKELQNLAKRDALTGIYNRNGLKDTIIEAENNLKNETFSIILIDIDYFKKINDNYGHDVGDLILKEFSQLINKNTREEDVFARWGGEEFIIVSKNSNLNRSLFFAEKIRELVENHKFSNDLKITCSIGVAESTKNKKTKDIFKEADKKLYEAKVEGRNRVK